MTRPQIIRADTIDLQDQSSPSAQDHSLQPSHPSPLGAGPAAPHQAASVNQIAEERKEEKDRLAEAWHSTDPDDGQEDGANGTNGEHIYDENAAIQQNGGQTGQEDGEMAESGTEEAEDDMIDKISSSPSIDDGGLPFIPRWPARSSSLSTTSSPMSSPTQLSPPWQQDTLDDSSSPFNTTPRHFPLSYNKTIHQQVHSSEKNTSLSFDKLPGHFPLSITERKDMLSNAAQDHHHLRGEYNWKKEDDEEFFDMIDSPDEGPSLRNENPGYEESPTASSRKKIRPDSPPPKVAFARGSIDSLGRETEFRDEGIVDDLESILLPTDDPLLTGNMDGEPPLSPHSSSSSWISDDEGSSFDDETANDDSDFLFSDNDRFVDSGWGGECLQDLEDIDFEFVYALHTFVATVEGQANATKGDTMVLLDDSNSYWWLVRIVKDSSIGYLPAEHIETPTERLARLNKHRNIDLSATMLGDNPEKSKNPLKKALRRKNAKTVTFTAPTYVEPSEYGDYSDEEEERETELNTHGLISTTANGETQEPNENTAKEEPEKDETAVVEPLKINGTKKGSPPAATDRASTTTDETLVENEEEKRTSDEIMSPPDPSQKRSRNGTVRNTDSFFKDDSVETRKITLTPNLLRDDSSSTVRSIEVKESDIGNKLRESVPPSERPKDDKKRKEKKPGMLSGLFKSKKKDKRGKVIDEEDEKDSTELSRGSSPTLQESSPIDKPTTPASQHPVRQTSKGKLQKSPPGGSPSGVKSPPTREPDEARSTSAAVALDEKPGPQPSSTMRIVPYEPEQTQLDESVLSPQISAESQTSEYLDASSPSQNQKGGKLSPITNLIRNSSEPRPEKLKKAKQRVELDDFDSTPEEEEGGAGVNPFDDPRDDPSRQPSSQDRGATAINTQNKPNQHSEPTDPRRPPALTTDTSSNEDDPVSPVSPTTTRTPYDSTSLPPTSTTSSTSTPTITSPTPTSHHLSNPPLGPAPLRSAPHPPSTTHPQRTSPSSRSETDTPPTPSSQHTSTASAPPPQQHQPPSLQQQWSDTALHAYMADPNDIRDMLLIVKGREDVVPVSTDHPLMQGLFERERKRVGELQGELDGLLGGWMERKGIRFAGAGAGVGAGVGRGVGVGKGRVNGVGRV